jgi:NADH-quinone oxidoreductase subunit N
MFSNEYMSKVYAAHKEYYSLLFFAIFGMMCIAHSNNLIVLFIGIETMSITFYGLTGFLRNRETAVEGALKYFLLGSFASGFLLYGIAMLYGATGSMDYTIISESIQNMQFMPIYLKLGVALLLIGLLFKVAAFPFHQWAPDVYQAAASPISGFMSTAGKIAALSGFIGIASAIMSPNITSIPFTDSIYGIINAIPYVNTMDIEIPTISLGLTPVTQQMQLLIAIIAALTMLIGNITAVRQTNIKRMLAYSSVGHAGYMLMGIVANSVDGISGILYYSIAYTLTQIGAFAVISILERKDESCLNITDYAGLSKAYPALSAMMAIFMFSLAGIPPFAGFFGKYFIFKAAIESGFTWLTIVAVFTSIIACYFYLSVIVQMYFRENESDIILERHTLSKFTVVFAAICILIIGVFPLIDIL